MFVQKIKLKNFYIWLYLRIFRQESPLQEGVHLSKSRSNKKKSATYISREAPQQERTQVKDTKRETYPAVPSNVPFDLPLLKNGTWTSH